MTRRRSHDRSLFAGWAMALLAVAACSDPGEPGPGDDGDPQPTGGVMLESVASGLQAPVHLTAPPNDERLFVVEQRGTVRIIENGTLRVQPFLDLRDRVRSGGERGLLSIAFHPAYASNGFIFASYTDDGGDTRIERYRVSADPNVADPSSAHVILSVEQPFANHNGGLILFGPDGMLYIGLGDGGSGGDPLGHGQNRSTLLGALLRIDVDGGDPYVVPADNPFASQAGARGEIWAYGLRNPWRFSFDAQAGVLFVADVGQNAWEEVNAVSMDEGGLNYGWNRMEGRHCYQAASCDMTGLVQPVLEYANGAEGCAVTGGFVYRGSASPTLRGHYFYGDACRGWLRSFRLDNGAAVDRTEWSGVSTGGALSFGTGADGEVYVLSAGGTVARIVEANRTQ